MDYLITFEDGSSGHLAHYGVKGMKWGVRNAETLARYGRNISAELKTVAKSGKFAKVVKVASSVILARSRATEAVIEKGSDAIDRMIENPYTRERAKERFASATRAASSGLSSAAVTLATTGGNVPAAALSFGANYIGEKVSQKAVKAGKPYIDKLIKNPTANKAATIALDAGVGFLASNAVEAGVMAAGKAATNALTAAHISQVMSGHNLPSNLIGARPKPHNTGSGPAPGGGISAQLYNANIPESLKKKG